MFWVISTRCNFFYLSEASEYFSHHFWLLYRVLISIPFYHHPMSSLLFENYVQRLNLTNDYFIVKGVVRE